MEQESTTFFCSSKGPRFGLCQVSNDIGWCVHATKTRQYLAEIHELEEEEIDGGWGWLVVFACFLTTFVLDGIGYSFGMFMKPLKEELQELQRREIITPVECSTDWISGMVVVQKQNGKPRVCIDPRPLNKALKRSHFPLPTIEDIIPDLSRAKVFTVCDVKSGFWHVKL